MPNRWFGGAPSYRKVYVDIRLIIEKRPIVCGLVILVEDLSFIFLHVNFMWSSRAKALWATHELLERSVKLIGENDDS